MYYSCTHFLTQALERKSPNFKFQISGQKCKIALNCLKCDIQKHCTAYLRKGNCEIERAIMKV